MAMRNLAGVSMRYPAFIAAVICLLTAAIEGVMAGSGVRTRFAELKMPRFAPSLWAWSLIGVGQYTIFFLVLRSVLAGQSFYSRLALVLAITVLLFNATWNAFFFRLRDLKMSFLLFIPYDVLAASLAIVLWLGDDPWSRWFLIYPGYLLFATLWGYRIWRLNAPVT
jgi:tryptophan-rich sensory protein